MPKKQKNENNKRKFDTVELGGVYFNIRTHEIIGFIPAGKLQTEIEVDLIALSVDLFSVKNDFIYTQLSYIHTLNFQKAKRFLKRKEVSFSSKKERRKRILDLLNDW